MNMKIKHEVFHLKKVFKNIIIENRKVIENILNIVYLQNTGNIRKTKIFKKSRYNLQTQTALIVENNTKWCTSILHDNYMQF